MGWFGGGKPAPAADAALKAHPLAPGPVAPNSLLGTLAPPDAALTRSTATASAQLVAKRTKQKAGAAGGSLLTGLPQPINTPAVLAAKSLIGS